MSRIAELIEEFCPAGVEYRRIEELLRVCATPRGIKRSAYALGSTIPIVDQGQSLISGYTDDHTLAVAQGTYIVFGDHTRAVKWVDFPFAVGADGTKVLLASEVLVPKFAYYAMSNLNMPDRGYNRHWTIVREMRIPIPPLPVQEEIVRILDTFSALEAELEAELEARKQQYEHYRDTLFTQYPRAEWRPLSSAGSFERGSALQKKHLTDSGVPCFHYGQVYTHYGVSATTTKSYVTPDFAAGKRLVNPGDVFIATTSENEEDLGKSVAWLGENPAVASSDAYIFRPNADARYVSYFLASSHFQEQKRRHITGTKVKRLSGEAIGKIEIPMPSRAEQVHIADTLDNFDLLVNDLSIGLPAELAARRKQYEYYRDRLLTFEELSA